MKISALLALPLLALTASRSADPDPRADLVVSGTVRDAAGVTRAGARVWLATRSTDPHDPALVLDAGECDGAGRFRLATGAERFSHPTRSSLELIAWSPGSPAQVLSFPAPELPVGEEIEVCLEAQVTDVLRVLDPDGCALSGARVAPAVLTGAQGTAVALPEAVREVLATRTDAQGLARIDRWLPGRAAAVVVTGPDGRTQRIERVPAGGGWLGGVLRLGRVGELRLAIEGEGPTLPLHLRLASARLLSRDPAALVGHALQRVACTSDGPPASFWPFDSSGKVEVRSPDPRVLRLAWQWDGVRDGVGRAAFRWTSGTPVRGRVVEAGTGRPLPGVRLAVTTHFASTTVETDADGTYAVRVAPGLVSFNRAEPPATHQPREFSREHAQIRVTGAEEAVELPDFVLLPEAVLAGRVLDASGVPVAGAWVTGELQVPVGALQAPYWVHALTDGEGRYVLRGVTSGGPELALTARHGRWRTAVPRIVDVRGALDAPVDLALPGEDHDLPR